MSAQPVPDLPTPDPVPAEQAVLPPGFPGLQQSPKPMNGETLQRQVTITNPQGFHMRPATAFAQLAGQFQSSVFLYKGDQRINGKSPLELMFLGAEQGTELTLEVSGSDARTALEALAELLAAPALGDEPEAPPPPKG